MLFHGFMAEQKASCVLFIGLLATSPSLQAIFECDVVYMNMLVSSFDLLLSHLTQYSQTPPLFFWLLLVLLVEFDGIG
ncbi:hypothetical protein PAXRUDRAFT_17669 [Paxillus rubicundulus Ve08.2h10]|uniref:Uncharacterized protein n=1 Tax=Paxillus rubicundulus Ve08.2h10 TaxID=930991 RepID=A0A0D0C1T3_9AGAM|nr:hypothetical protein PAXRUDRAFT_17669 [Paxillus rubicundulus Ve08.2h10]